MLLIVVYLFCTVLATATTGCKPAKINYYGFVAKIYRYHLNSHMGWHPDFFSDHYKRYHWSHGIENRLKSNIKEQKPLKVVKKIKNINFDIHASSYEIVHGEVYGYPTTVSNFTLELSGYFRAHSTGTYTFRLAADNGATLQFGSGLTCCDDASGSVSGKFHIETMGPHGGGGNTAKNVHMASFDLTEGIYYPVKIVMFNWRGNAGLHLSATDPSGETTTEFGRAVFQGKFDQKCTTTITSAWKKTFSSTKTQLGALTNTVVVRVPKATITRTIAGQHTYAITRTVAGELTNTIVVEKASSVPILKTSKKPLKKTTVSEKSPGITSSALLGHPSPIEVSETQSGTENLSVVKPPAHHNKHKNHFESTFHRKNASHEKSGFLALTCIQSLLGKARRAADLPEYCLPEEKDMSAALSHDELFDPSIHGTIHDQDGLEHNAENSGFDNSTELISNTDEKSNPDFEKLFGEYMGFEETFDEFPEQEAMKGIPENELIDSTVAKTSLVSSFGNMELISPRSETVLGSTKESTATRAISTISGSFDGFGAGNLGEDANLKLIPHHTMVPPNSKAEDEAALSLRRDQLFLALVRNHEATLTATERDDPRSENSAISSGIISVLSAAGSTIKGDLTSKLPSMKSGSVIHDAILQPNEPEMMSYLIVDDSALDSAAEPLPMSGPSPSHDFIDQRPEENLMGNAVVSRVPEIRKVSFYSDKELSTSGIGSQSKVWKESKAEPQPSVVSNSELQEHSGNVVSLQNIVSGLGSTTHAMHSSFSGAIARESQSDVAKGHIAPEKAGQVSQTKNFEKENMHRESLSSLPDLRLSDNIHETYTWGSESAEPATGSDVEPIQALSAASMQNLKLVDTRSESVITPLDEGVINNTGFGVSLGDESQLSGSGGKMAPALLFAEETAGVSKGDHLSNSEFSNETFEAVKLSTVESVSTNHSSTPSPGLLSTNISQPKETGTVGEDADMVPGNEEVLEEDLGEVFGNGEKVIPEETHNVGSNSVQYSVFESTSSALPSIPFSSNDSSETMSGLEASFFEKYRAANTGFGENSLVSGSGNKSGGFTPAASSSEINSSGSSEVLGRFSIHSPESEELMRSKETMDVSSASPVKSAGQESGRYLSEHQKSIIHEAEMHKSGQKSAINSSYSNANTIFDEIDLVSGETSALSGAGVVSKSIAVPDLASSTFLPSAASGAFSESKSDKIAFSSMIPPEKTAEMHLHDPAKDPLATNSNLDMSGSPKYSFEKGNGQAADDANVTRVPSDLSGSPDSRESLLNPGSSLANKNSSSELASLESDTISLGSTKENIMDSTPSSMSFDESTNIFNDQVTDKVEEKSSVFDAPAANDTSRNALESISALGAASMSIKISDLGSDSGSVSVAEVANLRAKDGSESTSGAGSPDSQTNFELLSTLSIRNSSKFGATEIIDVTKSRASLEPSHSKYSVASAEMDVSGTEFEVANLELLNTFPSNDSIGSSRLSNSSRDNMGEPKTSQSINADSENSMGNDEFEDDSYARDEDNIQNLFGVDVFTSLQGSLNAYKAAETGEYVNDAMNLPSKSASENEVIKSESFESGASKVVSQAAPFITSDALKVIDENQIQVDTGESIIRGQLRAMEGLNSSSAEFSISFAKLQHENESDTDTLFHQMASSGEYSFSGSQPAKSSEMSGMSNHSQISASDYKPFPETPIDSIWFADARLGSEVFSKPMAEVYRISQTSARNHGHEVAQNPFPSSHGEFSAKDFRAMPPAKNLSQDSRSPAFSSGLSMVKGVSQTDRDGSEIPPSSYQIDVIPSSHASFPQGLNQVLETSKHPDFDSYSLQVTEESGNPSYFVDSESLFSKIEEKAHPKSSETPVRENPSQTVEMELSLTDLADSEFDDLHGNGQGIEISTDAFETPDSPQEETFLLAKSDFELPNHSSEDSTSASLDAMESSRLTEFSARVSSLVSKTFVSEDDSKSDPSMTTGRLSSSSITASDSSSQESVKEPQPLGVRKSVENGKNIDSTGPGTTIVPANNASITDTIISQSSDAVLSSPLTWAEVGKGQDIIDDFSHSSHQGYPIHETPAKSAMESQASGIYAESVPSPSTQGAAKTGPAWSRIEANLSSGKPSFDVYDFMRIDGPSGNDQNMGDENALVSRVHPIGESAARSAHPVDNVESLTISESGSAASEVASVASFNGPYSVWVSPIGSLDYSQKMADIRKTDAQLVAGNPGDGFKGTSWYDLSQTKGPKEKSEMFSNIHSIASANEKDPFAGALISGNATVSIASESMISSAFEDSSSIHDVSGHSYALSSSPTLSTSHSADNSSRNNGPSQNFAVSDAVNSKDYETLTNQSDSAAGVLGNSFIANLREKPQSGRHDTVDSTDLLQVSYLGDTEESGSDSASNISAQNGNLIEKEHSYVSLLEDMMFADEAVYANDDMSTDQVGLNASSTEVLKLQNSGTGKPGKEIQTTRHVISAAPSATMTSSGSHLAEPRSISTQQSLGDESPLDLQDQELDEDIWIDGFAITNYETLSEFAGASLSMNESSRTMATRTSDDMEFSAISARNTSLNVRSRSNFVQSKFRSGFTGAQSIPVNRSLLQNETSSLETGSTQTVFPSFSVHVFEGGQKSDYAALQISYVKMLSRGNFHEDPTRPMVTQAMVVTSPTGKAELAYVSFPTVQENMISASSSGDGFAEYESPAEIPAHIIETGSSNRFKSQSVQVSTSSKEPQNQKIHPEQDFATPTTLETSGLAFGFQESRLRDEGEIWGHDSGTDASKPAILLWKGVGNKTESMTPTYQADYANISRATPSMYGKIESEQIRAINVPMITDTGSLSPGEGNNNTPKAPMSVKNEENTNFSLSACESLRGLDSCKLSSNRSDAHNTISDDWKKTITTIFCPYESCGKDTFVADKLDASSSDASKNSNNEFVSVLHNSTNSVLHKPKTFQNASVESLRRVPVMEGAGAVTSAMSLLAITAHFVTFLLF